MEHLYTIIFWVGVIYTVVTFLLGGLFEFSHLDGHVDAHIDSNSGLFHFTTFPLKPITIVSFITVFGGIGIIGTQNKFSGIFTFVLAFATGFITSFILYRFVVVPLYKAQNTSAVSQDKLIGMKAVVISSILEDGFGAISYTVNGNKYNAPAQQVNKKSVPQGEEVIIYEIKNNVFYVEPLNDVDLNFIK
jgi:membrane protein implicated in regulation of membrane protease activity